MITVKATTKKGQNFLDAYRRSRKTRLDECYGSYSTEKERADKQCRAWMNEEGGSGYRILSYCANFFTVGWINPDGNLRVETVSNSYLVTED